MATLRLESLMVIGLMLLSGGNLFAQQSAAELRLSLSIGSDYIHNGLSLTDAEPTARISADYEHPSGFFAGGFGSNVEFAAEEGFDGPRELEGNVYAGYSWRKRNWASNVAVARYFYPGSIVSYDYTQVAANVSFKDSYFFGVTRSTDYLSIYRDSYQYRAGIVRPTVLGLEFGLNAGKFRSSGDFDVEYSFWDAGVSRIAGQFALDLRYHDNTYDRTSLLGAGGFDRWVFSVSFAILPRERQQVPR